MKKNQLSTQRDVNTIPSIWVAVRELQNPTYKVFTALLTQNGVGSVSSKNSGDPLLTIGVTYQIVDNDAGSGWDFTNVGAQNNNIGTFFIATGTTPNSWGMDGQLDYNTGAPIAIVLENTIGNVWFEYQGIGTYFAKSNGLFATDKCHYSLTLNTDLGTPNGCMFSIQGQGPSSLFIQTINPTAEMALDSQLSSTPIEIRVYS